MVRYYLVLSVALAWVLAGVGCARHQAPSPWPSVTAPVATPPPAPAKPAPLPVEKPLKPEKNPPGDIPDTQVFVKYASPAGGYVFQAPEGWARTTSGANVTFTDKFDGVAVTITHQSTPPTVKSVKARQVVALQRTGRAVTIEGVKSIRRPGGKAILVTYRSNSSANKVTAKRVRLDNAEYLFARKGKLAIMRLWAPAGADNVDQWKLMSSSFRWR